MALPILEPAPVVAEPAVVFRDLFEHQCPCRHVQHDQTGLIVLPHKSLAQIARCILDSTDTTTLSRCFSEAPWCEDEVHRRRIRFMLHQTTPHRRRRRASLRAIDDTLCEHVGRRFDDVDRPYHHGDGTSPRAHNPVTSVSVSGPVRFPGGVRLDRRDEEWTPWEAAVAKPVPDLPIPRANKARHRLHPPVDPVRLQDPEVRARQAPFRTTSALAIALVEEASRHKVPCGVVVFAAWYLAAAVVQIWARRRQDWLSLLTTPRLLETASLHLRDANGWTLTRPGPHIAGAERVPLIPAPASRAVQVGAHTSGCCTLTGRVPGLGTVRLVVSVAPETLTGRRVVLVTNRRDGSAAKIIRLYWQRWPTDTFEPDGQGPLGCHASRLRSAAALGTPWGLVCVASALLHLPGLPAGPGRTRSLIHTLGDACRQQGRALLQKRLGFVHDQCSQGAPLDQVFVQVLAKQQGMALV